MKYFFITTYLFLILPIFSLAKECKTEGTLYNYYFINGVGSPRDTLDDKKTAIKDKLGLKKDVELLINPRNDSENAWFSFGPTWAEIKETF